MTAHTTQELLDLLKKSPKQTPVVAYVQGDLSNLKLPANTKGVIDEKIGIIFGDWEIIFSFLSQHEAIIDDYHVEVRAHNSALPLADARQYQARIEPGALIREHVTIEPNAVIMMGAIINLGAYVGKRTMIDMGAVLGGRAIVGADCHIGAGAVLAGVIEPATAEPVRLADNVFVGANAVILEGVQVGAGAIIGAGAVVTADVAANTVVAGVPARVIKKIDRQSQNKTRNEADLRRLDSHE